MTEDEDPEQRVPTILWVMLGFLLVALFGFAIALVGEHTPKSIGPAPGAPPVGVGGPAG